MVGKFESNKDLVQELTASGAQRVGKIASLITGTVAEVAREIGEFVTDAIEMREAAAAARRDAERDASYVETETEFVDLDAPVADDFGARASFAEPTANDTAPADGVEAPAVDDKVKGEQP
ncbi:hypothetical protein [Nocardia alba]|uniref:Uncharacterized protein n=1 Tax=Nocardia alba TaxID=225051 RepID=A0A4R1FI87_9NOCA|nr:hypothetical protein [Nocardia alba]TCJ93760.1 hypothetical protein DFR71_5614 [Nocardia alba]